MSVVMAWMMAKSPRMRIMTSCSRMFLTMEPRPIWARKASRSINEPSGLVFKKSAARLASNQATSASSTDRTKFRLSCCSLARCCSLSAMVRLHWVGAVDWVGAIDCPSDHVDHRVPLVSVHLGHRTDRHKSGVVDQDVEPAEVGDDY